MRVFATTRDEREARTTRTRNKTLAFRVRMRTFDFLKVFYNRIFPLAFRDSLPASFIRIACLGGQANLWVKYVARVPGPAKTACYASYVYPGSVFVENQSVIVSGFIRKIKI